jgi:hypothetical protein
MTLPLKMLPPSHQEKHHPWYSYLSKNTKSYLKKLAALKHPQVM